jgi:hypothetical protein
VPSVEGGEIMFRPLPTFSNFQSVGTDSPSKPAVKRVKRDGGGSTASERSSRVRLHLCPPLVIYNLYQDPSDDSQSFKMRLVYRDKGCAVCLAAGIQAIYKYREDSNRYEGAHIIDFAYHDLVSR